MFRNIKIRIKNLNMLCLSIGFIYLIFGMLKFFPHLSPAEDLAEATISKMTMGLIQGRLAIILLAILEIWIGIFLMFNIQIKFIVQVALAHMVCNFLPFISNPEITFNLSAPSLSLVGQYILKNLIIISTLVSIYYKYPKSANKRYNYIF